MPSLKLFTINVLQLGIIIYYVPDINLNPSVKFLPSPTLHFEELSEDLKCFALSKNDGLEYHETKYFT